MRLLLEGHIYVHHTFESFDGTHEIYRATDNGVRAFTRNEV